MPKERICGEQRENKGTRMEGDPIKGKSQGRQIKAIKREIAREGGWNEEKV